MISFWVSFVLIFFALLFLCLQGVWTGFSVFALVFLLALCIFWLVKFCINFFHEYMGEGLKTKFEFFCSSLIATTSLTQQDISAQSKTYYKKFKRSILKPRIIEVAKILFLLGLVVAGVSVVINLL